MQSGSVYSSQCPRHDPRDPGYRAPWQMPPATALALVAEVRRLTGVRAECERQFQAQVGLVAAETTRAESAEAEVGTLRARLAAAHEASETIERELICCDTYRMDDSPRPGHQICYWSAAAKAVLDAALATTGEGE